jgi:hypothetical protein
VHPVRGWAALIIHPQAESQQTLPSHVLDRFYAASLPPLTALYYLQPGLGVAATAALTTIAGVKALLRRRKPSP